MSNDKAIARAFKLWAKIAMMIVDGARDAMSVADVLQTIIDQPTRLWREEDGVIYFSVTSDGTTGPQWIERLEKQGCELTKWAKDLLLSPDFKPTNGVTSEVAVLKGMLFTDKERITRNIRTNALCRQVDEAQRRNRVPNTRNFL